MDILVFNWRDITHPEAGGAEVFTHEVLERLVERGHEVTLFTAKYRGADRETERNGVRVVRAGGKYSVYALAPLYYYKKFKGKYDVVVDEINTRPFMTPKFVSEPVVALIHQLAREFWFYEVPAPVDWLGYHILEDRWLQNYTQVPTLTVSDSTRSDLRGLGFDEIEVVPEGLDIEPLSTLPEKSDDPTFIFVGRMTESKRASHAAEALDRLADRFPDGTFHMVGDGYLLEDLIDEFGDTVTFHGYVSNRRKLELLRESHVILVPGVREGWGLVVTEANSMGTPAVGYDIHGLRDSITDRHTGLLCAPSPVALADKAIELYNSDYEMYAENALADSKQYNWDRTTDAIEEYLLQLM